MNAENTDWLNKFRLKYGRSPTVLHIGNIANNAYNNSKLLNQAGFDCDVICYDYYHTMACPEWEDAEFQATFENDNKPAWKSVDLQGFERPRWFAQGTQSTCINYLIARRTNSPKAEELWQLLRVQSDLANAHQQSISIHAILLSRILHFKSRLMRLAALLASSQSDVAIQVLIGIFSARIPSWLLIPALFISLAPLLLLRAVARPFIIRPNRQHKSQDTDFVRQVKSALINWGIEFPDRTDNLQYEDMLPYTWVLPDWKTLMKHYDIVIGYSTDPLLPMLANKPYYALEHGTIRDIPYAKTPTGRLCALSYRKALHVFVTNFDCISSAKTLAPDRFTVINHPYDEDHGLSILGTNDSRKSLQRELDSNFLVFHPTRHDWVEGTGYADKSNDVLIDAIIKLRQRGLSIGMVCCDWGKNVEETKVLLNQSGLSKHVKWVSPLPITPFERMCRSCDIVADQFKLGAFGGVCFKAMAVGAPILTYLNESLLLEQYPEVPPVINCRSAENIVSRLEELATRPEDLERMGQASRDWMKKYHSKAATLDAQADQFRIHLPVIS